MMKLITRHDRARVALQEYIKQFPSPYPSSDWGQKRKETAKRLSDLGDSPHPDKVDEALNSPRWTCIICDECDKSVQEAVVFELGKTDDDCGEIYINLCANCLLKALQLIEPPG